MLQPGSLSYLSEETDIVPYIGCIGSLAEVCFIQPFCQKQTGKVSAIRLYSLSDEAV